MRHGVGEGGPGLVGPNLKNGAKAPLGPRVGHIAPRGLSFLISKLRIMISPTSESHGKEQLCSSFKCKRACNSVTGLSLPPWPRATTGVREALVETKKSSGPLLSDLSLDRRLTQST